MVDKIDIIDMHYTVHVLQVPMQVIFYIPPAVTNLLWKEGKLHYAMH